MREEPFVYILYKRFLLVVRLLGESLTRKVSSNSEVLTCTTCTGRLSHFYKILHILLYSSFKSHFLQCFQLGIFCLCLAKRIPSFICPNCPFRSRTVVRNKKHCPSDDLIQAFHGFKTLYKNINDVTTSSACPTQV